MSSIWGEGLYAKYYFGYRLSLRRNSLVHEVILNFGKLCFTMTLYRRS